METKGTKAIKTVSRELHSQMPRKQMALILAAMKFSNMTTIINI